LRRTVSVLASLSLAALTSPMLAANASADTSSAAAPRKAAAMRSSGVQAALAAHAANTGPAAARAAASRSYVPSTRECTARGGANVKLDCDSKLPNNEPDVNVDPADPKHLVASSNDYDSNGDEFYTSFDAGRTWRTGDMSLEDDGRIGSDPVTVFDVKHDTVIHSSLNFNFDGSDGDLVVSLSDNSGLRWGKPVVVSDGQGADDAATQLFNDKEWMVTDNNPRSPHYGRTYLTWSLFVSHHGNYASSAIYEAHSDDGGRTWTPRQEISGSDRTCTFQTAGGGNRCDENQFSVPTVSADGSVYVAFQNGQHEAAWEKGELFENQYMVVRSHDGFRSFSSPVHVVDLEDGDRDYPTNVSGRQTLTGMQARVNSAGNIVANPKTGQLAIAFSDNRRGVHDSPKPVTQTNVYLMTSYDGVHWTGPIGVDTGSGDQWFPWVDANPVSGALGVLYNDQRGLGLYKAKLSVGRPESGFSGQLVSTAVSNADNSRFFQAQAKGCYRCTTFFGDYIRVAYGRDGAANMVWTDMSKTITYQGQTAKGQYTYFARLK